LEARRYIEVFINKVDRKSPNGSNVSSWSGSDHSMELWRSHYSIAVNQVMVATVNLLKWWCDLYYIPATQESLIPYILRTYLVINIGLRSPTGIYNHSGPLSVLTL
jgi:hypothetical protein